MKLDSSLTGRQRTTLFVLGTMVASIIASPIANACPFCTAVSQTIRQETKAMDAVVIAEVMDTEATRNSQTGAVRMKVVHVLKGNDHVEVDEEVNAIYFGEISSKRRFMLSGVEPPDLQWSCLPLTARAEDYVMKVSKLDQEDASERLRFFMKYLEDEDTMLSRDAYDEFAITPYEAVRKIKDDMDREQLIKWIQDPEMSADRKRLYLTMLGVCGEESDVPMLEQMLRSTQKSSKRGLDALIACYLTLAGENGLPLINELYLDNVKAKYGDTYSAVMAVRFHGTESDVIARSALVESLHHVLKRKDLADLVISDLARWEDWSQIDTVRRLFIEADEGNNFVRVPVVNYLKACPLPEAEEVLKELEEVDPASIKRANTFFTIPKPSAEQKPSDVKEASETTESSSAPQSSAAP